MYIYLAGMEQMDAFPNVLLGEVGCAFVSYYYLRNSKSNQKRLPLLRKNIKRIIVDSGAHSFFAKYNSNLSASVVVNKQKIKETPEVYFQKYRKWIKSNWNNFDYFVELDIGELIGQKQVLKWRKILKKDNLYEKCITVMHPRVVSWKGYLAMLNDSESKYVAIEGDRKYRKMLNYNKYIKEAYKKNIKIHGFAMTKEKYLNLFPFFSVDSTSWKAGAQYGLSKCITNKGLKIVNFKNKNMFFKVLGANIRVHSQDKGEARLHLYRLSILAYTKMEEYYTKLWKTRGIKW